MEKDGFLVNINDKQSIAKDALKLTISKIITMSILMLSAMLLSRFRSLEEYGTYSQILLVTSLVSALLTLGLPNSINFFLARTESNDERQKFISVYYTLNTIMGFITGLVLVLSAPIIIRYFNNPYIKNFIYVFAVYPWSNIVLSSIENICIVYRKTNHLMLFKIVNSVFILFIIVLVQTFNWDFKMYLFLFIVVQSLFALIVYFIARNYTGKLNVSFDKDLIVKIFKFSIPLGLASVVGTLSIELDKLVIGHYFNTEQLAVYANASREMPVTIIAASLTAVLMPQLARLLKQEKNNEAIALWGEATALSYMLICFFATGLFIFAPEVISLLYSDKYLPGITVFRISCIVLLLRSTYYGIILNSIGKTKFIFYSSVGSLVLNFALNYLFYYMFGFIGPAIATFISILAVLILQLIATSKSISFPFAKLLPWRTLGAITIINFLMGIVFLFIKKTISLEIFTGEIFTGEIVESILLGCVWGLIYFVIIRKFIIQMWFSLNEHIGGIM